MAKHHVVHALMNRMHMYNVLSETNSEPEFFLSSLESLHVSSLQVVNRKEENVGYFVEEYGN